MSKKYGQIIRAKRTPSRPPAEAKAVPLSEYLRERADVIIPCDDPVSALGVFEFRRRAARRRRRP